jgi:TolB protein
MSSRLAVAAGLLALMFAASAGPLVGAGSRGDSFPGRNGEIVFAVLGGDYYPDLYLMRPDGTKLRRITRRGAFDPMWSPDGKWIAFVSNRSRPRKEYAYEIYVMRPNGTGLRRLTRDRFTDYQLAWAPDGKRLVFVSNRASGTSGISVIDLNGSGYRRLTRHLEAQPAWSPDGTTIAFARDNPTLTSKAIWLMNPDGSNQRQLTLPPQDPDNEMYGSDSLPAWSPDGEQIAFTRAYRGRTDIYAIRLDGTRLRRLTKQAGQHHSPAWAPNGKRIVFVTALYQKRELNLMNADGTHQKRLSTGRGGYTSPDWQPLPNR